MNKRDAGSLWDMVNAIKQIQDFVAGLNYDTYLEVILIQSAVERQLEILGEAAGRVSREFRSLHPDVNWKKIIGLRNVLIHQYDEVQQEIVWGIVTLDLEPLKRQIEPLIPSLPEDN